MKEKEGESLQTRQRPYLKSRDLTIKTCDLQTRRERSLVNKTSLQEGQ